MVGFPQFFHVNDGHPVLKHPLYLKWNTLSATDIDNDELWNEVGKDLADVMLTNDNMAIIWYLSNILIVARTVGMKI